MDGRPVRIAKTGYTGEPIGYELYCESPQDAALFLEPSAWSWGARPTGLGARDTTAHGSVPCRSTATRWAPASWAARSPGLRRPRWPSLPSPSHPEKGDFIGREPLSKQFEALKKIMNRGLLRRSKICRTASSPSASLGRGRPP